ncbi:hypothetical protein N7499_003921 [Penicillium canescens]|nr:hypothetical protein N7499_003921 [Penicillium canescens]KAJ6181643.1 hypothetical protein N7485_000285 [Penicillium canescens]
MAPLGIRQSHSLGPGTPRPPKRPPNVPVEVHKSIDPKVFAELMAGTVGIFILAVLFWKLGQFIRRFSQNKVLRAGKSTKTRYARTWYGWVSRPTHDRNKRVIRDFFIWIRRMTAWKSTRADYSWVWWDPGGEERQKRRCELKGLWWLPDWLKSYDDLPSADEIWDPCSRPECHGALVDDALSSSVWASNSLERQREQRDVLQSIPRPLHVLNNGQQPITRSIIEELFRHPLEVAGSSDHHIAFNSPESRPRLTTRASIPFDRVHSLPSRHNNIYQRRRVVPWSQGDGPHAISFPVESIVHHMNMQYEAAASIDSSTLNTPYPAHQHGGSKRHRSWAARMQVGPKVTALENLRDSSGPPGTPMTELLASYISERSSSIRLRPKRRRKDQGHLQISEGRMSFTSRVLMGDQVLSSNEKQICTRSIQWNSAPARSRPPGKDGQPARGKFHDEWRSAHDSSRSLFTQVPRRSSPKGESRCTRHSTDHNQLKIGGPVDELSDWEVRLMERLDRKLVWVFNEFSPGQKPYHFALLANHWLNRETWIVYDPISRVNNDGRRDWGDPRFNVPYPEPSLSPRLKYPNSIKKRAHTPRIDSWRAAVNKQRKVSGIRDAIRSIELFEGSAEEPPDGHIDPACWALPKPPQGFEMSTSQKNAWYEGGAGWQEKLEDWQNVRWGYRLRKGIYEGRVNRGKVKEVVSQVNKRYRSASAKLIPSHNSSKRRAPNRRVS